MNQLFAQIQDLQDKVNSLNDEREFYDLETAFPVNPRDFRIAEVCLAAILACRTIHGTRWVLQETFLKSVPAQERISPPLPGTSIRHGEGLRREPQSPTIPTPRFSMNPEPGILCVVLEELFFFKTVRWKLRNFPKH